MDKVSTGEYKFLSLPDFKVRIVPIDKFVTGIKNKVLQFQEILPDDVLKVCKAQYEKQKKDTKLNNRRK